MFIVGQWGMVLCSSQALSAEQRPCEMLPIACQKEKDFLEYLASTVKCSAWK